MKIAMQYRGVEMYVNKVQGSMFVIILFKGCTQKRKRAFLGECSHLFQYNNEKSEEKILSPNLLTVMVRLFGS